MCKVVVEDSGLRPEVADRLTKELDDLIDRIRRRAYSLFEERGGNHGSDLEDWFRAEEELLFPAKFELVQEPGTYTLQLALPGFATQNVRVCTLGDGIVVKGKVLGQSCGANEESAKRYRDLFQWWPLPVGAHIGGITTELKDNMLRIKIPVLPEREVVGSALSANGLVPSITVPLVKREVAHG